MWIAGSAAAVTETLMNRDCLAVSTQDATAESAARSDDRRAKREIALAGLLASLDLGTVDALTHAIAREADYNRETSEGLSAWTWALPLRVLASIAGFSQQNLPEVEALMGDLAASAPRLRGTAAYSSEGECERMLVERFKERIARQTFTEGTLLAQVRRDAEVIGWNHADDVIAHFIGWLARTHEAAAGLIGNAVAALLSRNELLLRLQSGPELLAMLVAEVNRYDPSIHNVRRFVAVPTAISGYELARGDTILVVLAAANRDARANARPHEFLFERPHRRTFTFAYEPNGWSAEEVVCTIATAVLDELLRQPLLGSDKVTWTYRPSINARIPTFT
jgi:cytochrome P450